MAEEKQLEETRTEKSKEKAGPADILTAVKQHKRIVSLVIFAVIALIMILLGILALKVPVVWACILILMEVVIAALLHKAELWIHGMLLLGEVIAGILAGKIMLVFFCAIVYVAATVTQQIVYKGEK